MRLMGFSFIFFTNLLDLVHKGKRRQEEKRVPPGCAALLTGNCRNLSIIEND